MKSLYPLLGGSLLLAACQRQPETKAVAAAPIVRTPYVTPYLFDTVFVGSKKAAENKTATEARPVAPTDSLLSIPTPTPQMLPFLKQNNLSPLWQTDLSGNTESPALDGFFSSDHYRISFVLTSVTRDKQDPAVFHVQGKDRYKKLVTPFEGTLTVEQIKGLSREYLDLDYADLAQVQAYTATAHFELAENLQLKSAGVYKGTALLDFYRLANGHLALFESFPSDHPTRGSGLIFKGEWKDTQTGQRKPVAWARYLYGITPDILQDFFVGERSQNINPKYAKLGWDKYWENDEWWAEPSSTVAKAQP